MASPRETKQPAKARCGYPMISGISKVPEATESRACASAPRANARPVQLRRRVSGFDLLHLCTEGRLFSGVSRSSLGAQQMMQRKMGMQGNSVVPEIDQIKKEGDGAR